MNKFLRSATILASAFFLLTGSIVRAADEDKDKKENSKQIALGLTASLGGLYVMKGATYGTSLIPTSDYINFHRAGQQLIFAKEEQGAFKELFENLLRTKNIWKSTEGFNRLQSAAERLERLDKLVRELKVWRAVLGTVATGAALVSLAGDYYVAKGIYNGSVSTTSAPLRMQAKEVPSQNHLEAAQPK